MRFTSLLFQDIQLVHDLVMTENSLLLFALSVGSFGVPGFDLQVVIFRVRCGNTGMNVVADSPNFLV